LVKFRFRYVFAFERDLVSFSRKVDVDFGFACPRLLAR
jgi:hypothetical protein